MISHRTSSRLRRLLGFILWCVLAPLSNRIVYSKFSLWDDGSFSSYSFTFWNDRVLVISHIDIFYYKLGREL